MGTTEGSIALMPLPRIGGLFIQLKGAKYFTALDLQSGCYYIKLDEESIPKSSFTTVFGKCKFLRLPFGLSQGPYFFIHLIYNFIELDKTSTQGQGSGYLVYLDDILIYSRTEKDHLQLSDKAFRCLLKAGPEIKLSKCSFLKEKVLYLGHLVSGTSILPLANKSTYEA